MKCAAKHQAETVIPMEKQQLNERIILSGFSNMQLGDFHYHIAWDSWSNSFIELVAKKGEKLRHLRFKGVSNLKIGEGFNGSLSGMLVLDISARQWDSACIEVPNIEQDPGITFLALSLDIISDT